MNRIRIHLILFSLLMAGIACYSQSPNLISYQTVIRNGNNELVSNTTIGVRISILGGPEANVLVYQEEHTVKTNINGLAYLTIGNGKILNGLITSIDWSKGPYFIKSETDPTGGKNYTIVVLSQMLSVPYAIYSSTAEKLTGTLPETDPVFNGSIAKGITATDTSYWNKKLNSTDTSRMLANYLKKSDAITTGGVETDPVFNGSIAKGITATDTSYWNRKLNTADTSRMLANYRTSINNKLDAKDTTLMLSNYLKKSDVITTGGVETDPVFNGSIAKGITATDTSYWNKKLNTSDTLGMLTNYRTSLNQKLNITDTAKMLVPYLRDADTTNMLANYRISINNKLDAKDTTLMLSNYLKKSEGLNESDPLFNGSIAKGITAIDTSSWNRKLNSLDTSGMLANYRTSLNSKLNISDTTKMLSVYLKSTDTIQMSNKIQELVTKVSNLDSNSLNFNSSYNLKSFTISQGETQIFIDTLVKDNEIWEFQIFLECDGSSSCSGSNCATRKINIPISFLDANEIKLIDNSYFKSYKAIGGQGAGFPGGLSSHDFVDKLYPLSNINNDIIYDNEAQSFNCLYNRFFEGNFFWNLKKNSVVKIKAIYSGGSPTFNTRMIIKILKR
jgi:hypothetical protein